ncbi:hypothetical protein BDP27DRAFT_71060 [Rhodocollybia butyracea]|uniref:Uncharacterized protein n=1 Tax=Rhodocollybia butyracea TaxID=206335 RepID=A0A9P5PNE2_9AGAR|nr:hypothetical protein BDP27DRAFT_71060 [Rhodocollybia butyracea]
MAGYHIVYGAITVHGQDFPDLLMHVPIILSLLYPHRWLRCPLPFPNQNRKSMASSRNAHIPKPTLMEKQKADSDASGIKAYEKVVLGAEEGAEASKAVPKADRDGAEVAKAAALEAEKKAEKADRNSTLPRQDRLYCDHVSRLTRHKLENNILTHEMWEKVKNIEKELGETEQARHVDAESLKLSSCRVTQTMLGPLKHNEKKICIHA